MGTTEPKLEINTFTSEDAAALGVTIPDARPAPIVEDARPLIDDAMAPIYGPDSTIRAEVLFNARLRLVAAALQGLLAGPPQEGCSQAPRDLSLVAVQHADAALWAILEKPCTHPDDDDKLLLALDPHLRSGMTDEDVSRAVAATFGARAR